MSEIPLNKFEKEKRVIEMSLQNKTIIEIAQKFICHLVYLKDNQKI